MEPTQKPQAGTHAVSSAERDRGRAATTSKQRTLAGCDPAADYVPGVEVGALGETGCASDLAVVLWDFFENLPEQAATLRWEPEPPVPAQTILRGLR